MLANKTEPWVTILSSRLIDYHNNTFHVTLMAQTSDAYGILCHQNGCKHGQNDESNNQLLDQHGLAYT